MNALEKIIRETIAAQGAISLATYMELALQHPTYGYYRVREPLGREGDFVTAPEISQMFGEMIGVWCAETWRSLGKPDPFALVELGPGRGTMMRDILRATAHVGGFHAAKKLYLVDSDQALRDRQREVLSDSAPQFIEDPTQLPAMPAVILANEFFDALPVRQFERGFSGWGERVVTVEGDALVLALRPLVPAEENLVPPERRGAVVGSVLEICPRAQILMRDLAASLVARKGAMLVIDYGYVAPSYLASVQAVSRHQHADIFDRPGEVDLTAHVDFPALAQAARETGAQISPILSQGEFLKALGIDIRADSLKKHATLPQAAEIDSALHRLTDEDQMGGLFKVVEVRG